MNASNFTLPSLTDYQFQSCSWTSPEGATYLELPHTISWYFQALADTDYPGLEQAMSAQYDFVIHAIGAVVDVTGDDETLVQIQWPDGRFLSNPGLPVWDFIGTGLRGWNLENPELIAHGSKVKLNVDNTDNSSNVNLALFFEGVLRIPMVQS